MGMILSGKSSCGGCVPVHPKHPDPKNYNVQVSHYANGFSVLLVHYPNCSNYEGKKILVLKNWRLGQELDPHFLDGDDNLVARFRPTEEGWNNAILFANTVNNPTKSSSLKE